MWTTVKPRAGLLAIGWPGFGLRIVGGLAILEIWPFAVKRVGRIVRVCRWRVRG